MPSIRSTPVGEEPKLWFRDVPPSAKVPMEAQIEESLTLRSDGYSVLRNQLCRP